MREEDLEECLPAEIKVDKRKLAAILTKKEISSAYGYVSYVAEHRAVNSNLAAALMSQNMIAAYKGQLENEKKSIVQQLYNAGILLQKYVDSALATSVVQYQLNDAVLPHILFFLYAGAGLDIAEKYRAAAKDYAAKYPEAVAELPESYRRLLCS